MDAQVVRVIVAVEDSMSMHVEHPEQTLVQGNSSNTNLRISSYIVVWALQLDACRQ
jgi:hypothetical protein